MGNGTPLLLVSHSPAGKPTPHRRTEAGFWRRESIPDLLQVGLGTRLSSVMAFHWLANANFMASPGSRKEGVVYASWCSKLQGHTVEGMDEKGMGTFLQPTVLRMDRILVLEGKTWQLRPENVVVKCTTPEPVSRPVTHWVVLVDYINSLLP